MLPRPPAVARVVQRISATAKSTQMFRREEQVLVAVSGGPDSLCLLHGLARLQRLLRIKPICFHFDHALRDDSRADAAYVRVHAKRLRLPFVQRQARSGPSRGQSVEAWAREARYEAILAVLEEVGGGCVALGHTQDDQAETVLLALARGGGLASFSAMRPVSRPFVRPLLDVTGGETAAFCRALHLRPRRDPMNEDPRFFRAAIRTRVLPVMEETLGRNIKSTLARTAALARADADFLEELARIEAERLTRRDGDDRLLRAEPLAHLPPPMAGRIVRAQLLALGGLPEESHIEGVLSLAAGRPGRAISLPGGLRAKRDREYVRLSRSSPGP